MALAPLHGDDPPTIGGYRLIGRLGAGGMGVVFLADHADGQLVAIKQMHAQLAADAGFRARFGREAIALTRVHSSCTARVLAVVSDTARPFLVMDYVRGLSVADQVAASGPLTPDRVRAVALGLATALTAIHAAGVVHRDLKPANVMLGPDGPRVIDFGIAQVADATALTGTGMTIGSPGFMAPEQVHGDAGAPADVFAWALTVVFTATGRPPFGTGPAAAVLYRVVHADPDITGTPPELLAAVQAALAKDPAARPTAAALLRGLLGRDVPPEQQEHAGAAAVTKMWAHTREVEQPPTTPARRRVQRWGIPAAVAVALLLLAGLAGILIGQRPTPAAAGPATPAETATPATAAAATTSAVDPPRRVATRITIYQPWTPGGLSSQITATARTSGSCFSASVAVGRVDAFRCSAGSEINDPCFTNPFGSGERQVACPNPDLEHVVVITLTDPLPDPSTAPAPSAPWMLELTTGTSCTFITGATATVADLRLNYGCTDGGNLYGAPDTSTASWTIRYQAKNSPNLDVVPISAAYE